VPDDIAPAFWDVARENITRRDDLADWWALCRDGAEPAIAPEDEAFVAEALTLLPDPPYGPTAWADWTAAVKEATGRKGRGLFMPLRKALTGREHGPDMGALMPLSAEGPRQGLTATTRTTSMA
jgi:glutamyl-tRNA synthetase